MKIIFKEKILNTYVIYQYLRTYNLYETEIITNKQRTDICLSVVYIQDYQVSFTQNSIPESYKNADEFMFLFYLFYFQHEE